MRRSKQFFGLGTPGLNIVIVILIVFCCALQLTSAEGKFEGKCTQDNECETKFCSREKKVCDCPRLKDHSSGKKLEQVYDHDLGLCLSRVGQWCTLKGLDDGLPPYNCIPEATCETINKRDGPSTVFGKCNCHRGFTSRENGKRCISNAELRVQAPISMDQKLPDDWSRSGASSDILNLSSTYAIISLVILSFMFPFR